MNTSFSSFTKAVKQIVWCLVGLFAITRTDRDFQVSPETTQIVFVYFCYFCIRLSELSTLEFTTVVPTCFHFLVISLTLSCRPVRPQFSFLGQWCDCLRLQVCLQLWEFLHANNRLLTDIFIVTEFPSLPKHSLHISVLFFFLFDLTFRSGACRAITSQRFGSLRRKWVW